LRLPDNLDGLIDVAQHYYQCNSLLAVAGSQAAIQVLPQLRKASVVGFITPSYTMINRWSTQLHIQTTRACTHNDTCIWTFTKRTLCTPTKPSLFAITQQ
jgi:histidinol-phosphate/aromatic aminotransferase/cobyric acid decarboxylase-like protein